MSVDLFGLAAGPMLTEKQRRRLRNKSPQARGYAAVPGTGPEGQTCGTCHHIYRTHRFRKCNLMRRIWTHGPGTDIKARTPACSKFEKPSEQNPKGHEPCTP